MISGRQITDACRSIDVRQWQRHGMLEPGYSGSWQWSRDREVMASIRVRALGDSVRLSYRYRDRGGEWQDVKQEVPLETTACRYGGVRYWFRCPGEDCGRRVAILYGAGRLFACRHCYGLVYTSQRENAGDRALRRAAKLRERLGWEPGILTGQGGKPKWMRWRTYIRLQARAAQLTQQSLLALTHRFKMF